MAVDIREDFNIESFYGWMDEVNDNFIFPVQCDEDPTKCAVCEEMNAIVEVTYKRKGVTFSERTCMRCYAHPDYQDLKHTFMEEIISVKLI